MRLGAADLEGLGLGVVEGAGDAPRGAQVCLDGPHPLRRGQQLDAASARMPTLASDLALRTPATSPTAASSAGSPGSVVATSAARGHAARCTEPSCHHDQTSSVT